MLTIERHCIQKFIRIIFLTTIKIHNWITGAFHIKIHYIQIATKKTHRIRHQYETIKEQQKNNNNTNNLVVTEPRIFEKLPATHLPVLGHCIYLFIEIIYFSKWKFNNQLTIFLISHYSFEFNFILPLYFIVSHSS